MPYFKAVAIDFDGTLAEGGPPAASVLAARGRPGRSPGCPVRTANRGPSRSGPAAPAAVILVDNSLRHGEPGGTVEVRADKVGLDLRLEVSDRGPGIPAEHRSKVFEPFYQLDRSRSGSSTGLGLAIVRWIVSAHGGTIKLMDNGPGLLVRILLPLRGSLEDANGSPARAGSSAKKAIRKPNPSSTT